MYTCCTQIKDVRKDYNLKLFLKNEDENEDMGDILEMESGYEVEMRAYKSIGDTTTNYMPTSRKGIGILYLKNTNKLRKTLISYLDKSIYPIFLIVGDSVELDNVQFHNIQTNNDNEIKSFTFDDRNII